MIADLVDAAENYLNNPADGVEAWHRLDAALGPWRTRCRNRS